MKTKPVISQDVQLPRIISKFFLFSIDTIKNLKVTMNIIKSSNDRSNAKKDRCLIARKIKIAMHFHKWQDMSCNLFSCLSTMPNICLNYISLGIDDYLVVSNFFPSNM